MANQSYLSRIQVDAKEKEKAELVQQAEDAGIQVQADISAAKKALRSAEREFEAVKSASPFNSEDYISALRNLEEAKKDLSDLVAMQSELFSAE